MIIVVVVMIAAEAFIYGERITSKHPRKAEVLVVGMDCALHGRSLFLCATSPSLRMGKLASEARDSSH